MALLKKCELWFIRVVPGRPNKKFNRENPTWEVQIRTSDPKQKKEWEAQGVKLKAVVPEDGSPPFWRTTLKKKIRKKDGSPNDPVEVKAGNLVTDIDPETIGNGSVGNVRIFQYEYPRETGGTGIASVLMGIQLTKLKKYTPKQRDDDYVEEEMEVIEEEEEEEGEEVTREVPADDDDDDDNGEPATKPKLTPPSTKPKFS